LQKLIDRVSRSRRPTGARAPIDAYAAEALPLLKGGRHLRRGLGSDQRIEFRRLGCQIGAIPDRDNHGNIAMKMCVSASLAPAAAIDADAAEILIPAEPIEGELRAANYIGVQQKARNASRL